MGCEKSLVGRLWNFEQRQVKHCPHICCHFSPNAFTHLYYIMICCHIMKLLPPSKPGGYYDSTTEAAEDCNKQTDNEDFWFGGSCVINKKNILMNPASRSFFFFPSSFNPCNAKGKEMCNKGGCWDFHFPTFVVLIVKIDFGFSWLSLLYFLITLYCWTQTPADNPAW